MDQEIEYGFVTSLATRLASALFIALPMLAGAHDSSASSGDDSVIKAAIEAAYRKEWRDAERLAKEFGDPDAVDLVAWWRLREGDGTWQQYRDFLRRHGDWPGLKRLRRAGEANIPEDADPHEVVHYFERQPPQTGVGAWRLTAALKQLGRHDAALAEARRAWAEYGMDSETHAAFIAGFGDALADLHVTRLDSLLWKNWIESARLMLDLVPADARALAKTRIALKKQGSGVDAMIRGLPGSVRKSAGLAHDRLMWRLHSGFEDSAVELMLEVSESADTLGRPEKWAFHRRVMARDAMEVGDDEVAYELASQHGLTEGSNYAELEWLAGYLALRKLDQPDRAAKHFLRFRDAVQSPISLGRANYWLGRAHEALGNGTVAEEFYAIGAKYQTSFYGQLAAQKVGAAPDPTLIGDEQSGDWRNAHFVDSGTIRAAKLYLRAGWEPHARWFFAHVAEELDRDDLIRLGDMALDLGSPYVAMGVAKEAAKTGIVIPRAYYPVTDLAKHAGPVLPEMALSIARTESEFRIDAVSGAGARGLMQVLPSTAEEIAERFGDSYSRRRLTYDWEFNAKMGTAYLKELLTEYDDSHVLTFTAYNAGPGQTAKWLERFGHPHEDWSDPIDWIEHIPYAESRNYVMRVMESLFVYRARMAGRVGPISIHEDIRRGS